MKNETDRQFMVRLGKSIGDIGSTVKKQGEALEKLMSGETPVKTTNLEAARDPAVLSVVQHEAPTERFRMEIGFEDWEQSLPAERHKRSHYLLDDLEALLREHRVGTLKGEYRRNGVKS